MIETKDSVIRRLLIGVLTGGLVLLTPPAASAQQTIYGTVVDDSTERPVGAVSVMLLDEKGGMRGGAISDSNGVFSLLALDPGKYTLRADASLYAKLVTSVFELVDGEILDIQMRVSKKKPIEMLETVTVTAERERFAPGPLQGFYDRKRRGLGHFLTREQIEEKGVNRFTSLLRLMHGVRIVSLGGRQSSVRMRGFGGLTGTSCVPQLYWDGVRTGKIDGISDLGPDVVLFPSDLEAIEVYTPSSVPGEFAGSDARCGVIVVWSRRSP